MPDSEEEIYSTMFSSLKHPARRKILRMLAEKQMTFSQMLEALGVSSSHLTYHLENLVNWCQRGKRKLQVIHLRRSLCEHDENCGGGAGCSVKIRLPFIFKMEVASSNTRYRGYSFGKYVLRAICFFEPGVQ